MKRLKKIISIVSAAALFAATVGTGFYFNYQNVKAEEASWTVKVTTDATEVKQGDTLVSTVSFETNPGFAAFELHLEFDKDVLEITSIEELNREAFPGSVIFPNNKAENINEMSNGKVGMSYGSVEDITTTGAVLKMTFKVKDDAKIGKSEIKVIEENTDATNFDVEDVPVEVVNAEFQVECNHTNLEKNTVEATCTEPGKIETVCNECGEVVSTEAIAALGHDFGDYIVTKAPTCTEAGEETAKCSRCEATDTKELAALGHDFGDYIVTKAPTCTEAGEETAKCSRCEATDTKELAALGHDFGDYTVTKAPTCTEAGEKTAICTRCGEVGEKEAIAALGHDFGEYVVTKEATCTEPGEETATCTRCGEVVTKAIPAIGHDVKEWEVEKEPTETEKGVKKGKCSICGEEITEEIPKLEETEKETEEETKETEEETKETEDSNVEIQTTADNSQNVTEQISIMNGETVNDVTVAPVSNVDAKDNVEIATDKASVSKTSNNSPKTGDDTEQANMMLVILSISAVVAIVVKKKVGSN